MKSSNNMKYLSTPKVSFTVTLFPMVPLSNVVIDNLHLFLRVADVLIDLLIVELRRHDCIDQLKKFACFDPLKYQHIDFFQKLVSRLGIPGYSFYNGKDSKVMKVRSLTGPEKLETSTLQIRSLNLIDLRSHEFSTYGTNSFGYSLNNQKI